MANLHKNDLNELRNSSNYVKMALLKIALGVARM